MCGIAGLIGGCETTLGLRIVRAMTNCLVSRGPDAEGVEAWPRAILGHRRLSIFDLSPLGNQPMLSADRRVGVVFNGAIYNFLELRRELEEAGCVFRSRSDTEVLIHGYTKWGIDEMLPKLRGMFAICLWDESLQKCFLVRDRLGVKPLLYTVRQVANRKLLAFASTARALYEAGFASDLDEDSVAEFLEFGYITDDRCIYKAVHKVQAGEIVTFDGVECYKSTYWDLPIPDEYSGTTFSEAVEKTEEIFLESVKLRLQADVTIAALLSGGVDSSLVCWAIAKLGGNVTAYTISTPNDPGDESGEAAVTAKTLGIPHKIIPLGTDDLSDSDCPMLEELFTAYGEPFACASALGMLRISKTVQQEATVLITGDGGDDIFLGYPEHNKLWMAQQMARNVPGVVLPAWNMVRKALPGTGLLRRPRHFLDYATGGIGAVATVHEGLPFYWRHNLLGSRLKERNVSQRRILWSHASATNLVAEFLTFERKTRFTGEFMTKVDGATMRYSLEARSPFLDHKLWEFAGSLPVGLRLRKRILKAVLRELVRQKIGTRVATAAKKGFSVPVQRWLAGPLRAAFQASMQASRLEEAGFIQACKVIDVWKQYEPAGVVPIQLWYLFVLERWLRNLQSYSSERQLQLI